MAESYPGQLDAIRGCTQSEINSLVVLRGRLRSLLFEIAKKGGVLEDCLPESALIRLPKVLKVDDLDFLSFQLQDLLAASQAEELQASIRLARLRLNQIDNVNSPQSKKVVSRPSSIYRADVPTRPMRVRRPSSATPNFPHGQVYKDSSFRRGSAPDPDSDPKVEIA